MRKQESTLIDEFKVDRLLKVVFEGLKIAVGRLETQLYFNLIFEGYFVDESWSQCDLSVVVAERIVVESAVLNTGRVSLHIAGRRAAVKTGIVIVIALLSTLKDSISADA